MPTNVRSMEWNGQIEGGQQMPHIALAAATGASTLDKVTQGSSQSKARAPNHENRPTKLDKELFKGKGVSSFRGGAPNCFKTSSSECCSGRNQRATYRAITATIDAEGTTQEPRESWGI
jgi:hypothetical protein